MGELMGIPFGCNFNSFRRAFTLRARHAYKIVISDFHYDDPFARDIRAYVYTRRHTFTRTHIYIYIYSYPLSSRSFLAIREITIALWRKITMAPRVFHSFDTLYLLN